MDGRIRPDRCQLLLPLDNDGQELGLLIGAQVQPCPKPVHDGLRSPLRHGGTWLPLEGRLYWSRGILGLGRQGKGHQARGQSQADGGVAVIIHDGTSMARLGHCLQGHL